MMAIVVPTSNVCATFSRVTLKIPVSTLDNEDSC